jgi:hypothetical protein
VESIRAGATVLDPIVAAGPSEALKGDSRVKAAYLGG